MPDYAFEATDASGALWNGDISAATPEEATQLVAQHHGLTVQSLQETAPAQPIQVETPPENPPAKPVDFTEAVHVQAPIRAPYWGLVLYLAAALLPIGAIIVFMPQAQRSMREADLQRKYDVTKDASYLEEKDRLKSQDDDQSSNKSEQQSTNHTLQYLILPMCCGLVLLGRRLRVRSAGDVLRRDKRAPVVYLRSFTHDSDSAPTQNTFMPRTEEEKMVKKLKSIGPVIAIGQPGETMADLGAARVYVSHQDWQQVAAVMIDAARLVLIRVGPTPGVMWEIARVFKHLPPDRIMLNVFSTIPEAFCSKFTELTSLTLPTAWHNSTFIGFTRGGEAILGGGERSFRLEGSQVRHILKVARATGASPPPDQAHVERLRELLLECEARCNQAPPFRLAWWAWALILVPAGILFFYPYPYADVYGNWWNDQAELFKRGAEFIAVLVAALTFSLQGWVSQPNKLARASVIFAVTLLIYSGVRGAMFSGAAHEVAEIKAEAQAQKEEEEREKEQEVVRQKERVQQDYVDGIREGFYELQRCAVERYTYGTMGGAVQVYAKSLRDLAATRSGADAQAATDIAAKLEAQVPLDTAVVEALKAWQKTPMLSPEGLNSTADIDARIAILDSLKTAATNLYASFDNYVRPLIGTPNCPISEKSLDGTHSELQAQLKDADLSKAVLVFLRDNWGHWQYQNKQLSLDSDALVQAYNQLADQAQAAEK